MIYVKAAWAALQRVHMELPIRQQFTQRWPLKNKRLPFPVMVLALYGKQMVSKEDKKTMLKRYKVLSEVLHGRAV
jgi:hypothetical protein